ncbi:MAG: polysaccharide biosynthesis C-terminal domain-containing protein [Sediminibacterium sp.]|nr:polysaccharide biosynthesis C-terminal domain-containing protein [Sediminibacterium sp.]
MQQKKFIFNLGILIFLNLLIKPFWILLVEPSFQYKVGNVFYGEYSTLFSFSLILTIFADIGLTNFNNKNITENTHLLSKHFSSMMSLKLALGAFYMFITIVLGIFIFEGNWRYLKLLTILSFNSFLLSFILYLRSNLLALHLFKTDSIISVLDRILMIGIFAVLYLKWLGLEVNVMNYVYTQTIGYLITTLIAFVAVLRKTHGFKLTWNWRFNLLILKKSFPFAVLILLMSCYNRIDQVMLERLLPAPLGTIQTSLYNKSFRLLEAANMIAYLFSVQLLPMFSRMIKFKENIENLVKLSFTLLITPALIIAVACVFYNDRIFEIIYRSTAHEGVELFGFLMSCFVAISTTYIFGTLLTANGSLKHLNKMALGGIVVNVTLNLILIPKYHAMGSAIASIITQFGTALAQVFIAYKLFKFKVNKRLIFALFTFIIGLVLINYLSLNITKNWMLNFVIMLILSGLLAFVTGIINIKSVLRFIKYK